MAKVSTTTPRKKAKALPQPAPEPVQLDAFEAAPVKRRVGRPSFRTPEELQAAYNVRRQRYRERLAARATEALEDGSATKVALVAMTADAAARLDLAAGTLDEAVGGNAKALREAVKSQVTALRDIAEILSGRFPVLLDQVEARQAELAKAALLRGKR